MARGYIDIADQGGRGNQLSLSDGVLDGQEGGENTAVVAIRPL